MDLPLIVTNLECIILTLVVCFFNSVWFYLGNICFLSDNHIWQDIES